MGCMTICIALKCFRYGDFDRKAILFATDTQSSTPYLITTAMKCRVISGIPSENEKEPPWEILFASSGDAFVTDEVYTKLNYRFKDWIEPEKDPSIVLSVYRSEIGDIAYEIYKKYMEREASDPSFQIMLGASDKSSTLLQITHEGKTRKLDDFGIIGSGQITGGELLLNEFVRENLTVTEAAQLASFVITRVGQTDPYVGGNIDLQFCNNRTTWVFTQPEDQIFQKSESRWDMLKKMWWKMQDDASLADKLNELLGEDDNIEDE